MEDDSSPFNTFGKANIWKGTVDGRRRSDRAGNYVHGK